MRNRGQVGQHSGTPERDGEGGLRITVPRGGNNIRWESQQCCVVAKRVYISGLAGGGWIGESFGERAAAHRSYRLFPFPPEAVDSSLRPTGRSFSSALPSCPQLQGGALQPT